MYTYIEHNGLLSGSQAFGTEMSTPRVNYYVITAISTAYRSR